MEEIRSAAWNKVDHFSSRYKNSESFFFNSVLISTEDAVVDQYLNNFSSTKQVDSIAFSPDFPDLEMSFMQAGLSANLPSTNGNLVFMADSETQQSILPQAPFDIELPFSPEYASSYSSTSSIGQNPISKKKPRPILLDASDDINSEYSDDSTRMKKKKKKKDPSAPKNPISAYLFFVTEQRAKTTGRKDGKSFSEVARELGKKWKELSADEKQPYLQRAKEDKERYRLAKKEFQSSH